MGDFRKQYLYWFNHYHKQHPAPVASYMAYRTIAKLVAKAPTPWGLYRRSRVVIPLDM